MLIPLLINLKPLGNPDGTIKLQNQHIYSFPNDILYHLGLGAETHDLVEMFGDVKVSNTIPLQFQTFGFQFVCMGGTPRRMKEFAYYMIEVLNLKPPTGMRLSDIAQQGQRYNMYKVGPILSVSVSINVTLILSTGPIDNYTYLVRSTGYRNNNCTFSN